MKLFTFKKGVHPQDHKHYTNAKAIEPIPLPDEVFIPLQQHIGIPCQALVKKGDEVKTGQPIGRAEGTFTSVIHSTVTGKVKAVAPFMHSMGTRVPMVHIKREGEETWELISTPKSWQEADGETLHQIIREAGIVGMGGAVFPTHIKLNLNPKKPIDSFILNGCECEPYLTCDHRMMVEWTDKILTGMAILMKVLQVKNGYIGIENNKPDAIAAMEAGIKKNGFNFNVVPLQVKYPQGAEKMLIEAVLQRYVPAGGLPGDVGVIVNNVGTAAAVTDAVVEGKPLIERVVTVTGEAVKTPKNVMARIGSTFHYLIDFCDGVNENTAQVFMGGPMMGISQFDLNVPVVKGTSGIVCTTQSIEKELHSYPCIRCNSCVNVCPVFLLPSRLSRYTEIGLFDEAEKLGIRNCIECGSCVFVCPSHIPILQWIRVGKFRVNEKKLKATG